MTKDKKRTPQSFDLPQSESDTEPEQHSARAPQALDIEDSQISITSDSDDMFNSQNSHDAKLADALPIEDIPGNRSLPFFKIIMGSAGLLLSLSIGLWLDALIQDLFSRNEWLGWSALIISAIFIVTVFALIIREIFGFMQLRSVERLRKDIEVLIEKPTRDSKQAKAKVGQIIKLVSHRPETANGRQSLKDLGTNIIDGPDYLALAETELMQQLDDKARHYILNSAKRVSLVTAISPRALLDAGFVLYEMVRLSRQIANLYGSRPGFFGTISLLKAIAAHLAVTGGIAIGENMFQQLLGQSLAAKLSTRFGEGLINGVMTARLGIVAMDVSRPMPFQSLEKPTLSSIIKQLSNNS